jgi:hypothetical protein
MSKSPKIRKSAGTARRTATSRQSKSGSQRRSQRARENARDSVRNGTKQALLIELLSGTKGASVPEMADKAGWQPRSRAGAGSAGSPGGTDVGQPDRTRTRVPT